MTSTFASALRGIAFPTHAGLHAMQHSRDGYRTTGQTLGRADHDNDNAGCCVLCALPDGSTLRVAHTPPPHAVHTVCQPHDGRARAPGSARAGGPHPNDFVGCPPSPKILRPKTYMSVHFKRMVRTVNTTAPRTTMCMCIPCITMPHLRPPPVERKVRVRVPPQRPLLHRKKHRRGAEVPHAPHHDVGKHDPAASRLADLLALHVQLVGREVPACRKLDKLGPVDVCQRAVGQPTK